MKRLLSIIVTILVTFTFSLNFFACEKSESGKNGKKQYTINQEEYLFGIDNLTSDMQPAQIDAKTTNAWSAKVIGELGAKSHRIWIYFGFFIKRDSQNNLSLIRSNCEVLHDYIEKLSENGVERFVGMTCNFINPYEFNASNSTTVPSVYENFDIYLKFLDLMEQGYRMLAEEFPEIKFWEAGNEPDISHGQWFHKKDNTKFSPEEGSFIVADLCYRANRAIKSVNPENKLVMPGLTDGAESIAYLEKIYENIESGYLPTGEDYADKNTDNYFDYLAWHPYPTLKSDTESFVEQEKKMYDVVCRHGDEGKPVFYTEIGFSDYRFGGLKGENGENDTQERVAEFAVKCLQAIKDELPFVETAFWFRLTNISQFYTEGSIENSFGMFYSPSDPGERAGKPKPIAVAIYKFFNGENADESVLYNHLKG
ncbi:MAG: glycosyl hydrolase [Candidatus Borkfalkiaceae bacterium]|nr:glycosyl hydrolase [Christensenellaceae bacterium]